MVGVHHNLRRCTKGSQHWKAKTVNCFFFYTGASDSFSLRSFYSRLWGFCRGPACSLSHWVWLANASVWIFMSLSPQSSFPVCPLSVLWLVLVWALRRSHLNDGWLAITVIVMCGCLGLRSHLLPLALGPWKKTTSYSVPLWEFGCTKGFRAPSCCMEFIHTVLELQILTGVLFPGEKGRESKIP